MALYPDIVNEALLLKAESNNPAHPYINLLTRFKKPHDVIPKEYFGRQLITKS